MIEVRKHTVKSQNCSSFVGNSGLYGIEENYGEIHYYIPTSEFNREIFVRTGGASAELGSI